MVPTGSVGLGTESAMNLQQGVQMRMQSSSPSLRALAQRVGGVFMRCMGAEDDARLLPFDDVAAHELPPWEQAQPVRSETSS